MPEHVEPFARRRQDGLDLHDGIAVGRLEAKRQIDLAPVDLGREHLPGDVAPQPLERLTDGGPGTDLVWRRALDPDIDTVHRSLLQ